MAAFGARKYAERNWEKGLKLMDTYASAQRHLMAWHRGEDIDAESGKPHLSHAIWNLQAMIETLERIENGTLPRELMNRPVWPKLENI